MPCAASQRPFSRWYRLLATYDNDRICRAGLQTGWFGGISCSGGEWVNGHVEAKKLWLPPSQVGERLLLRGWLIREIDNGSEVELNCFKSCKGSLLVEEKDDDKVGQSNR